MMEAERSRESEVYKADLTKLPSSASLLHAKPTESGLYEDVASSWLAVIRQITGMSSGADRASMS